MTEKLGTIMSKLDEYKEQIPDGVYKELAESLKSMYDEKKKDEKYKIVWAKPTFELTPWGHAQIKVRLVTEVKRESDFTRENGICVSTPNTSHYYNHKVDTVQIVNNDYDLLHAMEHEQEDLEDYNVQRYQPLEVQTADIIVSATKLEKPEKNEN